MAGVEKPAAAPARRGRGPRGRAAPPPPPPDPPYVAAAKTRKKVPMWAAPVLAILPLWGFIYYQSLQKPPAGAERPARPRRSRSTTARAGAPAATAATAAAAWAPSSTAARC